MARYLIFQNVQRPGLVTDDVCEKFTVGGTAAVDLSSHRDASEHRAPLPGVGARCWLLIIELGSDGRSS